MSRLKRAKDANSRVRSALRRDTSLGSSGSYPLYCNPLLKAEACVEEGRVKVHVAGPLAHLPLIRSSMQMFEGQVAARAGPDQLSLSTWIPPLPSRAFDRLANSRMRALLGLRTPDQVTISITEECPNRCSHCALPNSGNKLRLSPHTVQDLINQILEMGTTLVIFDGGEPALYPDLPELVRSVDDRAISTLFTSGAGFTAELALQLKEAGLYAVNVSLDSPVAEEHDAMRGREGVFLEAMQAVKNALQAGLLVDLYVVLRRENICHLQQFHDLAQCIGAHELTFFEVVSTGRWSDREGVALTPEDHAQLADFVSGEKSASAQDILGSRGLQAFWLLCGPQLDACDSFGGGLSLLLLPGVLGQHLQGACEENLEAYGTFSIPRKQNMPHEKIRSFYSHFEQNCSMLES